MELEEEDPQVVMVVVAGFRGTNRRDGGVLPRTGPSPSSKLAFIQRAGLGVGYAGRF